MKKTLYCIICFIIMFVVAFFAKKLFEVNNKNNSANETLAMESASGKNVERTVEVESYKENGETLYKYTLYDAEGNVAYQEDNIYKEPIIEELDDGIIKIWWGAGSFVTIVRYYDSINNQVSIIYETPLNEYKNKLIRTETKKIIIQDMFEESGFYKEYEINTPDTAVPVSVIRAAKFIDDSTIEVTYLTGKDYKEVTERFKY